MKALLIAALTGVWCGPLTARAMPMDLLFSEYVEGSGSSKALDLSSKLLVLNVSGLSLDAIRSITNKFADEISPQARDGSLAQGSADQQTFTVGESPKGPQATNVTRVS